jgi:hypothetical protein
MMSVIFLADPWIDPIVCTTWATTSPPLSATADAAPARALA